MKPINESQFVTSKTDKIESEISSSYDTLKRSVSAVFEQNLKGNVAIEKMNENITKNMENFRNTMVQIRENQNFSNDRINDIYLYIKTKEAEEEKAKERWMFFRASVAAIFLMAILVLSFIGLISLFS